MTRHWQRSEKETSLFDPGPFIITLKSDMSNKLNEIIQALDAIEENIDRLEHLAIQAIRAIGQNPPHPTVTSPPKAVGAGMAAVSAKNAKEKH